MLANVTITEFGAACAAVKAMQFLKQSRWFPLIQEGQAMLNRIMSVIIAAALQVGIGYTWDPATHTLVITGLTIGAVMIGAWHIFCQYAFQESIYQATINNKGVAVVPVAPVPAALNQKQGG